MDYTGAYLKTASIGSGGRSRSEMRWSTTSVSIMRGTCGLPARPECGNFSRATLSWIFPERKCSPNRASDRLKKMKQERFTSVHGVRGCTCFRNHSSSGSQSRLLRSHRSFPRRRRRFGLEHGGEALFSRIGIGVLCSEPRQGFPLVRFMLLRRIETGRFLSEQRPESAGYVPQEESIHSLIPPLTH